MRRRADAPPSREWGTGSWGCLAKLLGFGGHGSPESGIRTAPTGEASALPPKAPCRACGYQYKKRRRAASKSVAARRRRAGSPAMPSLEDDEDAKAVKQDAGDIPPIVQKVTIA